MDNDVTLTYHFGPATQEIQLKLAAGRPGGMEVIFRTSGRGVTITVYNPYRGEWISVDEKHLIPRGA